MNVDRKKKISKRMSFVLRHDPESIGVELSDAGWIDVDVLISAMQKHGFPVSLDELKIVVAENEKQRFEFSSDGNQIRARQGHSIDVDLNYESATPPDTLYHGTASQSVDSIFASGLDKRARHAVHMSTNREMMIQVGGRHGKPVILAIDAGQMVQDGHVFYVTGNNVWLTDNVPASYISLAD